MGAILTPRLALGAVVAIAVLAAAWWLYDAGGDAHGQHRERQTHDLRIEPEPQPERQDHHHDAQRHNQDGFDLRAEVLDLVFDFALVEIGSPTCRTCSCLWT